MPHQRDDFPRQTVTLIAKGVGYHCSNPECNRLTVAANAAQDDVFTIGVAAHVRAAAPGGPRYDPEQSRAQRIAPENGIWLCQNCARLVDADPKKFTVEGLSRWKREAQAQAFRALVASAGEPSISRADLPTVADSSDCVSVQARMRQAAAADLATYRRASMWSNPQIELTLRIEEDDKTPPFGISKLPAALEAAPEISIVAQPGTGKTTTLLQLAGHMLSSGTILPVYVHLGDWAASGLGLLESIGRRQSYSNARAGDLRALARCGLLALLLDGWNELDQASRQRLRRDLEGLRREYPSTRFVATTRRQSIGIPLAGPRLAIEPLSEDQQLAIARAQAGDEGAGIVDDAWRSPGVRELITIPLYLSALVAGHASGASPATKDGILRIFVDQHENAIQHAEVLEATLCGCHRQILTALAMRLSGSGASAMAESEARRIVTEGLSALHQEGQILTVPEPLAVLEALSGHHLLTRSGLAGEQTIGFQHQQFQEWFASFEVAELMRNSAISDSNARSRLRLAVLDRPAFEEPVLFAAERMSREAGGGEVAAQAVMLALSIDPMLAAEMIYRAAPIVWDIVRAGMIDFAARWHKAGAVDRAARFMIMTGRPEFAPTIWPLATDPNSQVQIPTLRTAPRFRPSVLGSDIRDKVRLLDEQVRRYLLSLMASESGVEGMDLAVELAAADPSPTVQGETVLHLVFRRAERHVACLLRSVHEETWRYLAARDLAFHIQDAEAANRLHAVREQLLAERKDDPFARLILLENMPRPQGDVAIADAVADPRLPLNDQRTGSILHRAFERAPAAVGAGLMRRIEAGLSLPFGAYDYLKSLPVIDDGPIAERILNLLNDDHRANAVAVLAGPGIAKRLLDRFLVHDAAQFEGEEAHAARGQIDALRTRVQLTRPTSFVAAILGCAASEDVATIVRLSALISEHGEIDDRATILPVDGETRAEVVAALRRWVAIVTSAPQATPGQWCALARAIGRFGMHELVFEFRRLLDEDLRHLRETKRSIAEARRVGARPVPGAAMLYGNQYEAALASIGGEEAAAVATQYLEDQDFGPHAALVLKAISDAELGVPKPNNFDWWHQFDRVDEARASRARGARQVPASNRAAPIFAAIGRLARPENETKQHILAIKLAPIASGLPHEDQDALMDRVLALPRPLAEKRLVLTAMVLEGRTIEAVTVMHAIDDWLARAQTTPWEKQQATWQIEPWLELLPFTDRPASVVDGLTKVKAFYANGWVHRWERVLAAVAALPGAEGEALLIQLARVHADVADQYAWSTAFLGRRTGSALLAYADLAIEGVFVNARSIDICRLGEHLAVAARKFPQLRSELRARCEAGSPTACGINDVMLGEACRDEDLIAMIKSYVTRDRPYDGTMASAVRAVTIHRTPIEGSAWYSQEPATVGPLRRQLFEMLTNGNREALLARQCLVGIDTLRDEYGAAPGDPRHPNVMSELAWPEEARGVGGA